MSKKKEIQVTQVTYFTNREEETTYLNLEEFLKQKPILPNDEDREGLLTWIHFTGVQDSEILEKILNPYNIHELVIEDILSDSQQTKAEIYLGYLFLVGRCFDYSIHNNLKYNQLFLLILPSIILTFEPKAHLKLSAIHKEFNAMERDIEEINSGFLAYILLDFIINQSYPSINILLDKIEKIDQKIFIDSSSLTLNKVHKMKQTCTKIRSSLRKMNDTLQQIMRWNHHLIDKHSKTYFRDLVDITHQMCDRIDYANEVIQSITGTYLNIQSNQLNLQMRLLTVVNIIFMPLSLLAGIYGMNFDNIPGIHNTYGYYLILGIMVMITIVLLTIFKKKNWL